jgi:gluconolactonase
MLFETPSTIELLRNSRGVLSGEQRPRSFASPVRLGDFNASVALPLAGYQSTPYARLTDPQGLGLRITHRASSALPEPVVQFNVYGGPKQGFLCPEPWFGIQNSLNLKQSLVTLSPGGEWQWTVELRPESAAEGRDVSSAGVEKVAGGFEFVEGPVWSRQGYLLFSDIPNQRIFKVSGQGPATVYRDQSNAANGNAMDVQGRLYSCERDGRRVVRADAGGKITVVADRWQGKKLNSPNDVAVRRDGQVYFTDPASTAVKEPQELGFNGVYQVTPEGELSLVTGSMRRPNGVALSPDGKLLYVADSQLKTIVAFDLDAKGKASRERLLISGLEGSPDGLRVAESGNLYIACRGIAVYTPEGKLLRTIEFPEPAVNCAFGDPDLRTLYVTARTSVYRVRLPEKGSLQY